jgi:ubiquitin C-terminal hydrolase
MAYLLQACRAVEVGNAEAVLGESFMPLTVAMHNNMAPAQVQEYATDATLPTLQLFGHAQRSTIYCSACKRSRRSHAIETQLCFQIPDLPAGGALLHQLQDAIDVWEEWLLLRRTNPDGTFEDTCPLDDQGCGQSGVRLQKLDLMSFPPVLILNVKRGLSTTLKDYRFLEFPPSLYLSQCPEAEYDLRSVVVHHGDRPSGGHYTSFSLLAGAWYHFNDGVVEQVGTKEVAHSQATLLLYTRHSS